MGIEVFIMSEKVINSFRIRTLLVLVIFASVVIMSCMTAEFSFAANGETEAGGETKQAEVKAPARGHINSLTSPTEHKVIIEWKQRKCDAYIIRYADNSKLRNAKRIVVSAGKTARTIKGLENGRKYWFKVRAYRNVKRENGKTRKLYGRWSRIISVRIHVHKYHLSKYLAAPAGMKYVARYSCSCGKGYYKSKTIKGKVYEGIVIKAPTCVSGEIKKNMKAEVKKIPAVNTHRPVASGKYMICQHCGQKLNYINTKYTDKATGKTSKVIFASPKNTWTDSSVALSVRNQAGNKLKYKLYWQKATKTYYKYPEYQKYLYWHGCSTCALTTILNATVPKYRNYTPDRVLEEVIRPAVGEASYKANFSKTLMKQMPIGLRGITKVLKANGVRYKYVYNYTQKNARKQIKEHLQSGNPVIFTIRASIYSKYPHTMTMLGLDKNGRIIVGDSSICSASKWGANNRLVKFNTTKDATSSKISKICKYFKYSTKSVANVQDFYHGKPGNIGYILVYKD